MFINVPGFVTTEFTVTMFKLLKFMFVECDDYAVRNRFDVHVPDFKD